MPSDAPIVLPLYLTLVVTISVVAVLAGASFAAARNPAASPHLGAELRSPAGESLYLDEPAPLLPGR